MDSRPFLRYGLLPDWAADDSFTFVVSGHASPGGRRYLATHVRIVALF